MASKLQRVEMGSIIDFAHKKQTTVDEPNPRVRFITADSFVEVVWDKGDNRLVVRSGNMALSVEPHAGNVVRIAERKP